MNEDKFEFAKKGFYPIFVALDERDRLPPKRIGGRFIGEYAPKGTKGDFREIELVSTKRKKPAGQVTAHEIYHALEIFPDEDPVIEELRANFYAYKKTGSNESLKRVRRALANIQRRSPEDFEQIVYNLLNDLPIDYSL